MTQFFFWHLARKRYIPVTQKHCFLVMPKQTKVKYKKNWCVAAAVTSDLCALFVNTFSYDNTPLVVHKIESFYAADG